MYWPSFPTLDMSTAMQILIIQDLISIEDIPTFTFLILLNNRFLYIHTYMNTHNR